MSIVPVAFISVTDGMSRPAYPRQQCGEILFPLEYHKDVTVWAKRDIIDGQPDGYWERFRKDGTKMRSGLL
jgi:hypothetical protein